jgi:serine/threonine protein kinase
MRQHHIQTETDKLLNNMYDIEKKLGEGCFGVIYKATNRSSNRPCALKI